MNLETWASMEVRFTFLRSHPREVQIDPVDVYHVKNGENLIETRDMESKEGNHIANIPLTCCILQLDQYPGFPFVALKVCVLRMPPTDSFLLYGRRSNLSM